MDVKTPENELLGITMRQGYLYTTMKYVLV